MKLQPEKVMLFNLLFRIFLIIYLLKEEGPEKTSNGKPLKYWMDALTKRVFLVFINGLQRDFLKYNSTPYLKEMVENHGTFAVALTGYMETNSQGIRTVLSGRYSPPFPFSYLAGNCQETILDYVGYKCAIGSFPEDIPLACYFPDKEPLENFQKFPGLFVSKNQKIGLYMLSLDLDPVWMKDYQKRLSKIDGDLRFLATLVNTFFNDNKTTYIVTSARSSPVGNDFSTDAPFIAWGKGIANNKDMFYMMQNDITAMLCALLGINYPSGLLGIIPIDILDLHDYFEFELSLYTIKHLERVLQVVDVRNYVVESSELMLEQLDTRLDHIVFEIRRSKFRKIMLKAFLLILLLSLFGIHLILFTTCRFTYFFLHFKSLFLLLLFIGVTLMYQPIGAELVVALEVIVFWTWQNRGLVTELICCSAMPIFAAVFITFVSVTIGGLVGNDIFIPTILTPVVLWPLFNGTYRNLTRFVSLTRLLSGIAIGVLPVRKVFGEMPDEFFNASISLLFLGNFFSIFFIFRKRIDAFVKINFVMIAVTNIFLLQSEKCMHAVAPCFLLMYTFLSVSFVSGTLLTRFLKIILPLFIPLLLFSIKIETVYYLSIVFQMFTWIFIEYHGPKPVEHFRPSIFSIEGTKAQNYEEFTEEEDRQIIFYFIYCYLSYFAMGHIPDLHSYDLYVLPTFVFAYPIVISCFLAVFKFFLPFFIVTVSFITICALTDKDFTPLIMTTLWLSDVFGCVIIFYSQFVNLLSGHLVFPARFSYFMVQQFASISVILSYFMGKPLLLGADNFLVKHFQRNKEVPEDI